MNARIPLHVESDRRLRVGSVCLFALALLIVPALAVHAQPPQERKPTNLKVLDTTMTHEQVVAVMRTFTEALGVGCDHCHAAPKPGTREIDFASDNNKIKLTARDMMRMTAQINSKYLADLPAVSDSTKVTVQCVTCHHGQPQPVLLQDVLKRAWAKGGMAAVDSTYRALRTEYYGTFTYDFSDRVLAELAMDLAPKNGADAMALLKLNKEFNPDSFINEYATGRVYIDQADTLSAIAAFKRSLDLNPQFRPARRALQMLGSGQGKM